MVFGELDWSPGILDQCIGRLWRDGQKDQVTATFVTINDGSDPMMKKIIGMKASEARQIMNPDQLFLTSAVAKDKMLSMAREYLMNKGVDVDTLLAKRAKERKGELFIDPPAPGTKAFEVFSLLSNGIYNPTDEGAMQNEIETTFKKAGINYNREVNISKESRVDFLVDNVIVECKVRGAQKTKLLRQIKKYKKDYPPVEAIIILTPDMIRHFSLEGTHIYAVNVSDDSLLMSGLA